MALLDGFKLIELKEKVEEGEISRIRYENYRLIFEELASRRSY